MSDMRSERRAFASSFACQNPCAYPLKTLCREATLMASLTLRGTVFGVDISVPLLEVPGIVAGLAATPAGVLEQTRQASSAVTVPCAAQAPSAEVAELQRRLATSKDSDVAALMANNPDQLDPLNVPSIARWLQAKGRNMDIAEEQIHVHAHWRQAFMPAGHIPEVGCCAYNRGCLPDSLTNSNCWYIKGAHNGCCSPVLSGLYVRLWLTCSKRS